MSSVAEIVGIIDAEKRRVERLQEEKEYLLHINDVVGATLDELYYSYSNESIDKKSCEELQRITWTRLAQINEELKNKPNPADLVIRHLEEKSK